MRTRHRARRKHAALERGVTASALQGVTERNKKDVSMTKNSVLVAAGIGLVLLVALLFSPTSWVEEWPITAEHLTACLLFVTLLVLWWYTTLTAKIAQVSREQIELQRGELRVSHKPFVVTDVESQKGHFAQNIGPGLAINVYLLVPHDDRGPEVLELGGLAPGGQATIESGNLGNEGKTRSHVLIAEALFVRTEQWTATLNVAGSHRVAHRPASIKVPSEGPCTLEDVISRNWRTLKAALGEYAGEQLQLSKRIFEFESRGTWQAKDAQHDDTTPQ